MRIEEFLKHIGKAYRGRIPLGETSLEGFAYRWTAIEAMANRSIRGQDHAWKVLAEGVTRLKRGTFHYGDLSKLTASYEESRRRFAEVVVNEIRSFVLALHDGYVFDQNARGTLLGDGGAKGEGNSAACRQCGECCIGPAEGPISTSPVDIGRWERLGRDDLLYYTLNGPRPTVDRAQSLDFPACPFLRFSEPDVGVCLVHIVKPLICSDFLCGRVTRRLAGKLCLSGALA